MNRTGQWPHRIRISVSALMLALCTCGCFSFGSESGFKAAKRLAPGLSRADALSILGEKGDCSIRKEVHRSPDGTWQGLVDHAELEWLREVESSHGSKLQLYVLVDRRWGWMGWDEFYLCFDQQDRLCDFVQRHLD
jgi:hypothetical protein